MDDMYEVKQAAIKAVLLLGQKSPSGWEYQEAAAQFKKSCRGLPAKVTIAYRLKININQRGRTRTMSDQDFLAQVIDMAGKRLATQLNEMSRLRCRTSKGKRSFLTMRLPMPIKSR